MAATTSPPVPLMEAFKPSPALASFITDIWVWDLASAVQAETAAALTLLPDGHPTMCFVYGGPLTASDGRQAFTTRSAVCGFQARPVHVRCEGHAAGITVRFRPHGLSSFFPASLAEATERRIDCRDLFARSTIEDLESALHELPNPVARVRCVERFLLTLLRAKGADALVERAVLRLCGGGGLDAARIREMARELGTTERTLERRFRHAIGTSPKMFARVVRLQAALTRQERPARWSELAVDGGFYDQAHLNRETRELFGASPSGMLAPSANPIARGFQALARDVSMPARIFR